MGLSNNDPNWRVPAHEDLDENTPVYINSDGEAQVADPGAAATCAVGIVPQAIKSGDMAPVIRQGKLSGLVGYHAGDHVYLAADGTLADAVAANPHFTQRLAIVCKDDPTTAYIFIEDPLLVVVTPQ